MTLSEAQVLFTSLIAAHVNWINNEHGLGLGVNVAFDEVAENITTKDPTSDHMKNSNHHRRLAADLLMFINGVYQEDSEAHEESAAIWLTRHPLCRNGIGWGDGGHYSIEWGGVS